MQTPAVDDVLGSPAAAAAVLAARRSAACRRDYDNVHDVSVCAGEWERADALQCVGLRSAPMAPNLVSHPTFALPPSSASLMWLQAWTHPYPRLHPTHPCRRGTPSWPRATSGS